MSILEPGDILLYREFQSDIVAEFAIDVGEFLEHGPEPHEYYHVAIVEGDGRKIESNTEKVEILEIGEAPFDPFRPPLSNIQIKIGLNAIFSLVNQPYDWWLIADEALREITDNVIHFDEAFIHGKEMKEKICSTLVSYYFLRAGFQPTNMGPGIWPKPTPEDIWLAVKDYPVLA